MKYIDIHCHLDSNDFDNDRDAVLARMKESRVGAITIGASLEESKKAVEIAMANENVWATIGIHPEYSTSLLGIKEQMELLQKMEISAAGRVVAIGECGLDYFRLKNDSEKEKQKELFESQIQFSIKHNKPLMLHIREAYNDALDILKTYPGVKGNVHFFAGDIEMAKRFLDLGFTLSFTGVITFTHDYDEVIKYIPQDSIMSETDAPWVAPVPFRGKRCEPVYVIEVIKKMAEIRGEKIEVLNNAILKNARVAFGIPLC